MGKFYSKFVGFIIAMGLLIAGCSKEVEVAETKEICHTEEECTRIGDRMVEKVYKKDGKSISIGRANRLCKGIERNRKERCTVR